MEHLRKIQTKNGGVVRVGSSL